MKSFPVGDRHKRIQCPDRYLADLQDDGTILLWDAENPDIPIRISVITGVPKKPDQLDLGFWHVIDTARKRQIQPVTQGDKSILRYREASQEAETFLHFTYVGLGNNVCIISITASQADESSPQFTRIAADVAVMIETLVERKPDEQFTCNLLECDQRRIAESLQELLHGTVDESTWSQLQGQLARAYSEADENLARNVGLAFGELLRFELPSLTWSLKVDEHGSSLALDLTGTTLTIFPEDMILKRWVARELPDLKELSDMTIATLERLFRDYGVQE
jgi:hypothetical protein